jgi:DNA-binding transcriptional LysR family regulator
MDLRQLSFFVAVADEGGIRAAARRLYIAQPQVSQALRRLETELGAQLMRRSSRGVELTAEGQELLMRSRDILDRVERARTVVRQMAEPGSSTLHIGLMAGVLSAGELLAPILTAYRRANPDVALHLEDLPFGDQAKALLDGSLDLLVVRTPLSHPELEVTPIAQEPRVLMVGAGHEVAGETSVAVEDIVDFPTLALDAPAEWSDFWQMNHYRGAANAEQVVAPVRTVAEAQLALAVHNLVVSSPAALGRLTPNPLIRVIPLTGVTPSVIAVACKRGDHRDAVHRFVQSAAISAERCIDLLPAGSLPH